MGILPHVMHATTHTLRDRLVERRRAAAAAHRAGASGFETCSALGEAMDEAVRAAFGGGGAAGIAVVAVGGYARRELSPSSDADVTVLCGTGDARPEAEAMATRFLHILWDAGVDMGHSVRSLEDLGDPALRRVDTWASLVEGRFVCGDGELAAEMDRRIAGRGPESNWFPQALLEDLDARHDRYGHSVKLLEPNIKKSAGGLRDIQTVYWLHRAAGGAVAPGDGGSLPVLVPFLRSLGAAGHLDAEEVAEGINALEFLLRVRHEMHYRRAGLHDTLEFPLQKDVAEGLGFDTGGGTPPVESFMRTYYLHARTIRRITQHLTHRFRESYTSPLHARTGSEKVGSLFRVYVDQLSVDAGVERFTRGAQLLEAFVHAAEAEADPDHRLRGLVARSLDLVTPSDPDPAELGTGLRRILVSGRAGVTLQAMNDVGLLGRLIPEFGDLVAFFQYNVYHYYTADEHTLIALANAEALRERQGVLHEVFRALRRKEILLLAVLLHDIGKPRGVADHEITGADIAADMLTRLGMEDAVPAVSFLVRHHLVMEQVAFRRNIHDADTIREFAALFERPELLDLLYLLTYADLSAVNRTVWTEWKSTMLRDLYLRTSEVLRRNLKGEDIAAYHREQRQEAADRVVEGLSSVLPRDEVERHLRSIEGDAYLSHFTGEEVREHIAHGAAGETVTLVAQGEGHTDVTVIARDAPFALSRCCAVLAANDATIFDASVFTRTDGVIIDRFRVSDAGGGGALDAAVCEKIASDMRLVLAGDLDIEHLFAAHHRRWKRRPKPLINPAVRTDVSFETSPRHTIIDVYAPDSVGLLYRITETISRLGLDIFFARIATRVDGVVDAFYVLERGGGRLEDPGRREAVRRELLDSVRSLQEQELR